MKLSKFRITSIETHKGDIRLLGRYAGEPKKVTRQVIVRLGKKATDLAMKKGEKKWELEIQLPPLSYVVFAALVLNAPTKCRFDRSKKARKFKIGYESRPVKTSARTHFLIEN